MKPYVYKITHPSGYFYIGARWANIVNYTDDFGIVYFTSTKNPLVVSDFQLFDRHFLECETPEKARALEKDMIKQEWDNPLLLNRNIPGEKFFCDGHTKETRIKMSESKKGRKPNNFGKPASKKKKEKNSIASKLQIHSVERRNATSARMIGNTLGLGNKSRRGQTQGPEERQKKRIALLGRTGWKPSNEQKENASKQAINRPRLCCLLCRNEMQINSFTRHHRSHNAE